MSKPPPSLRFTPAGEVAEAKFCDPPPFIQKHRRQTGRRRQGVLYERKVHEYFLSRYSSGIYWPARWIQFRNAGGPWRWCQPDAILLLDDQVVVIEVKYQHTFNAWHQLFRLYIPVVAKALGDHLTISGLEVVRWLDPSTASDPPPILRERPEYVKPNEFAVMIYNPRK